MKTSSFRQVIVAMIIAVSAATVHGAWFSTTDATSDGAPVASIRLSQWDHYQQKWLATIVASNETLRASEGAIIELRSTVAGEDVSLAGVNHDILTAQQLADLNIPATTPANTVSFGSSLAAPLAAGNASYVRLSVSELSNGGNTPPVGQQGPWSGPIDPTQDHLEARDINGSVGIQSVTLSTTSDAISFTWDIGRWAKGDVFIGLNEASYKVIDRDGNFKRFVATADYEDSLDNDYTLTTGCAANWKTGEVFATNFGELGPAINVITRHPDSALTPSVQYSPASRRVSTKVTRPDSPDNAYGIDINPESLVFDGDLNMYVGHSFGNFSAAPAGWGADPTKQFEPDGEYTTDIKGLPLEGWTWDDGWGWVVDENGNRLALAAQGRTDYRARIYGVEVSARMNYRGNQLDTARVANPLNLPDWPSVLPTGYWSDPLTGAPMVVASKPTTSIPYRWSMGKRLHRYNNTNNLGVYSPTERAAFWTFTGRQGTDWIDLNVTADVMYYTSEDSFIHRYNVATGQQLPDVGAGQVHGTKLLPGDNRFHGLRVLPPGDGTGGFLVATQTKIARFNADGKYVQAYQIHNDPYLLWQGRFRTVRADVAQGDTAVTLDRPLTTGSTFTVGAQTYTVLSTAGSLTTISPAATTGFTAGTVVDSTDLNNGLVHFWYTLEVDPGGRTFWASAHDTGWIYQIDIATGRELKRLEAVKYRRLGANGPSDGGRRVEGICVMWEYTAPQEICFNATGGPDGKDDDGDGFIDENCQRIEICSAMSPGDDDLDGLSDQYDSDCSAELPPVAIDDAYAMNQQSAAPNPTVLTVNAADGVLQRGAVDDYDRDGGEFSDGSNLKVAIVGVNETSLTAAPGTAVTTLGGSVVLQADGSFVYTPNPSFHGVDSFAYKVTDGYPITPDTRQVPDDGYNDIATVTITVAPKVANDGTFDVRVGESLSRGGLLSNDPAQTAAPSAGPVTISEAGSLAGPVAFSGSRTFQTSQGNTVTVNSDGSFLFTASNLAYSGLDYFTYAVHDTVSRSWNIATVTLNVLRPAATVTVPDQTKVYDGTPLSTTCTVTSNTTPAPYTFVLTYAGTSRVGAAYGPSTTAPTNAGSYIATCTYVDATLGSLGDTGTIVISPIPVVVKAHDKTIYVGDPIPTLDGVWTGFLTGESATATYATTVANSSATGTFPITPTPANSPVLGNYIVSIIPGTLRILPRVTTCAATGYVTYSQGGWGSKPSGGNPGGLLAANFATVYPGGVARVGGTYKLNFTSAGAVEKYLPAGGSAKVLTRSYDNPTSSQGGLSAQLLALQLAADFSRAGVMQSGLGNMVMQSGPLAGQTVDGILAMANQVFGGSTSALPSGMSLSGLSSLLESIIMNYHEGADGGLLKCGAGTPPPPTNRPPVAQDDSATTVTTTPVSIMVLTNDSDPDGDVVTLAPTSFTQPTNGSVTLSNNVFRFVAVSGFTGTTTFTYTITDGKGGTDTAVVTVVVTGVTPPPPSTGSGVCSGGVTKLVLKYIGTSPLSGVVYGQRSAPGNGPKLGAQVSGSTYTFAITDMGGLFDSVSGGRLANNFTVFIGNTEIADVHTSCSVPIYPGMKIGTQFEIVEVWTKGGGKM